MGIYIGRSDSSQQLPIPGSSPDMMQWDNSSGDMGAIPITPPVQIAAPKASKPDKPKSQGGSAKVTSSPKSLERKRRLAETLLGQGMDTSPIASPWQGAARMANALVGGMAMRNADQQEQQGREAANAQFMGAVQGGNMDMNTLAQIMSDPWASPEQQQMAAKMFEDAQRLAQPDWKTFESNGDIYRYNANDPNSRPEQFFDAPVAPGDPFTLGEGQIRFGPDGNPIAQGPAKGQEGYTLSPGQQRFGPDGQPIAGVPEKPQGPTGPAGKMWSDWEYANSQLQQMGLPPYSREEWETKYGSKYGPDGTNITTNINDMKLTEAQSKDLSYYSRMSAAEDELAPLENRLTELGPAALQRVSPDILNNYVKSPEYQAAERAGREFVAMILRKDTGAAVTPQEWEWYKPMYLPVPGDDPQTIAYKKEARYRVTQSIKDGLGTARGLADEIDKRRADRPSIAPPQAPPDIEPDLWNHMTPEEQQLFQ